MGAVLDDNWCSMRVSTEWHGWELRRWYCCGHTWEQLVRWYRPPIDVCRWAPTCPTYGWEGV